MLNDYSAYGLSKPLVIGEFNHMNGVENESGKWLYNDIYTRGYMGAWGWNLEESTTSSYLLPGMKSISDHELTEMTFPTKPNVENTCDCLDIAPSSDYTCA